MPRLLITVPSHRRPHTVETFPTVPDVWIVNDAKDVRDYRAAGADNVVASGGRLAENRNLGIELALKERAISVQCDDDLKGIYRVWHDESQWEHTTKTPVEQVANEVWECMRIAGTPLGGVYPQRNPFYAQQRVHTWGYIEGAFMVFDPRLPERCVSRFKEDWEMTCKVLRRVGCVARLDFYVMDAEFLTNPGGQNEYRTPDVIRRDVRYLLRTYPDIVRPHKSRPDDLRTYHTTKTMPEAAKLAYRRVNAA